MPISFKFADNTADVKFSQYLNTSVSTSITESGSVIDSKL